MNLTKAFVIVIVSMLISATVTLLTSHTHFGAPIALRLANWAEIVPVERFDDELGRQLDALIYPQTRPLMRALVMDQVAEHARRTRLDALRDPSLQGWQVRLPQLAADETELPPRIALGRLPEDARPPRLLVGPPPDVNPWLALSMFALFVAWVISRRILRG